MDGRVDIDADGSTGWWRAARRGKACPDPAGLKRTNAATGVKLATAARARRMAPRRVAMVTL